jgi:hypothetical protein
LLFWYMAIRCQACKLTNRTVLMLTITLINEPKRHQHC